MQKHSLLKYYDTVHTTYMMGAKVHLYASFFLDKKMGSHVCLNIDLVCAEEKYKTQKSTYYIHSSSWIEKKAI